MNDGEVLFRSGDLQMSLAGQQSEAVRAIENWDPEPLLATAEADVVDYLVAKYSVACPVLDRDRVEQLPISEEVRTVRDTFSRFSEDTIQYRMTKIVVVVPFTGDKDIFMFHPSRGGAVTLPRAEVRAGELRLTWTGDPQIPIDAAAVRRHFDTEIDNIDRYLTGARNDIERYNTALRPGITTAVAQRRAKLLADRQLEANLGFPVR